MIKAIWFHPFANDDVIVIKVNRCLTTKTPIEFARLLAKHHNADYDIVETSWNDLPIRLLTPLGILINDLRTPTLVDRTPDEVTEMMTSFTNAYNYLTGEE